jgi:glutathione S-transferase
MYKLYYAPGAASLALHWMLIELGVPFELIAVDLEAQAQKSPDYLALNPNGRVPTLVVDGVPHAEVAAMLMLLAERHPDAGFDVPPGDPARADYLQWMIWLTNTLQSAYRTWFYPDEAAGPEVADAAQRAAQAAVEQNLALLDAHFGAGRLYMVGDTMSAADFMAAMLTRWSRNMPRPATAWPRLAAYVDRMRARPALREVHAREGLTDWIDG